MQQVQVQMCKGAQHLLPCMQVRAQVRAKREAYHTISQTELAVTEVLSLLKLLSDTCLLLHLLEEVGEHIQGNLFCLLLGDGGSKVWHNNLQQDVSL